MDSLPEELLFHIFSFLSAQDLYNAGAVDHRWRRISDDERLVSSVVLGEEGGMNNDAALIALTRKCSQRLTHLDVSRSRVTQR